MAICIVKSSKQLGINFVLTPERYNPKRRMNINSEASIPISEIIDLSNEILTTKQGQGVNVVQINTSDAMGGYLNTSSEKTASINSNKKILKKGDVIMVLEAMKTLFKTSCIRRCGNRKRNSWSFY